MVDKYNTAKILTRHFKTTYSERPLDNDDYNVDDHGWVELYSSAGAVRSFATGKLPIKFKIAHYDFIVSGMGLKSLEGCPLVVQGDFHCEDNQLTSLQYAPKETQNFDCSNNQLVSLKYCPPVLYELVCNKNLLTSLESCPPTNYIWATENPFEHFRNTPAHVNTVVITWKPHLPLLGLLTVNEIQLINPDNGERMKDVELILNKYAGQGKRALFDCQKDLEDAGFEENARW
jgi:hypothetical protein